MSDIQITKLKKNSNKTNFLKIKFAYFKFLFSRIFFICALASINWKISIITFSIKKLIILKKMLLKRSKKN